MRTLFVKLKETIINEGDAVLVSVVASSGSTPRGSGAHMLITEQGRVCGTIGGGAVEYKSEQMAADVLRDKSSFVEHFRLHANDVADLGMICGGAVDVYFRYIPANDRKLLELANRVESLFAAHEEFWLICEMTGGSMGDMAVYSRKSGSFGAEVSAELISKLGSKPAQYEIDGHVYYCEQLQAPGKVYIFGGGHVAQELVPALARVGFRCVVIEDRPEFAKPELFEGRAETRLVDTAELSAVADEIDESLSLADRFGLFVTFLAPGREVYLEIVHGMVADRKIIIDREKLDRCAERFALKRNGRSPRVARQFVDSLQSKIALGIDIEK